MSAFRRLLNRAAIAATLVAVWSTTTAAQSRTPVVGDPAPDFTLPSIDGTPVTLSKEVAHGPVVLVLLRGWPGYHCPYCVRQFGEFLGRRGELEATGARVVWIYPAASKADIHVDGFIGDKNVPAFFRLLVDPGFRFTTQYGLRWDAPGETSYPTTFVIDRAGIVRFVHTSHSHGGRTPVADVLSALARLPSN